MAKANPVKQGFEAVTPVDGIECRWMDKNTVRVIKDGTTSGCDIKFEKYQDGDEYLVSKREHSAKIWLAIAIMRKDSQDALDFKDWIQGTITKVKYGEYK